MYLLYIAIEFLLWTRKREEKESRNILFKIYKTGWSYSL